MAPKQVTDILVRLGIEGLQGLDKVSSAFKDLQKTLDGPTTASIEKVRKSINEYGNASARTEQLIKGQLEALKGLKTQVDVTSVTYKKLNEDINRLETEMRGTTAAIDQQRQSILAAVSAGEKNIQTIRSQITALDQLRQQTRPGSSAFAQLSKDIDTARAKITGLASDAQDFSRALTGIPGASLDILGKQISNNRRAMQGLRIESDEFLSRLERISLLTARRDTLTGRQQVRASAAMYESPEYQGFVAERASRLGLPQTRAAFSQRTTEIQAELQNLQATESNLERILSLRKELRSIKQEENALTKQIKLAEEDTLDIVNRRINAQREVARASGFREFSAGVEGETAIAKSVRRARERLERENDRLRKEAAEAITISSTPLLPAAGGTGGVIAPGAVMGGGARTAIGRGTEITFGAPSARRPSVQANLPTAATGVAPAVGGRLAEAYDGIARSVDRARRPLREILIEISRTQQASNGSVSSLQAQISAWTELRNAVNASAPAFATATKNIQQLSRQQEALTGRGRITPGQAVQTAGAVISGGIFGGPEGFLGGLGGAALGASIPGLGIVGGAFAGSAAGAQLGMFRQQIAGVTDYAAQIQKLQISLKGVAGTEAEYQRALKASEQVTKDFNVSQLESLGGFTKLTASIKGAGGNVADSEAVFRSITAAIKATGGGAEQVQGALLAMSQIFSKGKVSAEELNQIGERLPGTFALFAQAAGKTGPELRDGLEKGTVGLADVVKFVDLVGFKYTSLAEIIADSSVDAGARAQIAFQNLQKEIGDALQPIGAQFQDAFAKFILEITPALVSASKNIASALKFLFDNRATVKFIADIGLAIGAIKLFGAALAGIKAIDIASMLAVTSAKVKITGDASGAAAGKVGLLAAALQRLAAIGIVTVGVNYITNVAKEALSLKDLQQRRVRGGAAAEFRGATRETVIKAQQAQRKELQRQDKQQRDRLRRLGGLQGLGQIPLVGPLAISAMSPFIAAEEQKLTERRLFAQGVVGLDPRRFRSEAAERTPLQKWLDSMAKPDGGKTNSGAAAAKAAAREAASDLKEQLKLQREIQALSLEAQRPIIEAKQKSARLEREIAAATERGDQAAIFKLERTKLDAEFSGKIAEIRNKERKELQASADNQDQTNRKLRDQLTIARSMNELRDAAVDQQEKITDLEERAARARASQTRDLTATVADRQRELGLISREDYNRILLQRERERLNREFGMTPEATRGQALDLYRQQIDPTATETVRGEIVKLEDEMRRLTDAGGMVVNAASEIGNAFGNSFRGIVDGSMSAQQALSGFFKNVANAFLEMAAQIIAKWLAMAALNAVLKLFPGGGAAAPVSPSAPGGDVWGAVGRLFGENAMGNAYAKNGIVPFAYGGVVNRPTLFPFAKGIGLMGEAGPEAILPLRRGSDGRLGVSSSGGGGTVVNVSVDASGTAVEGDGPGANQMGRIIGAAVQAEIVKMQRPGGLLANTR